MMNALTQHWGKAMKLGFLGASSQHLSGDSRSFESPSTNVLILMSNSSSRLGALAGQWDLPDPDALKALLQSDPEAAQRFYKSSLLSSEQESSGD